MNAIKKFLVLMLEGWTEARRNYIEYKTK